MLAKGKSINYTLAITKNEYDYFIQKCKEYPFAVRQLNASNRKKYDCTVYGKLCGVNRTNLFITKQGIYPCGRFYGNKKYNFGSFLSDLNTIQLKMSELEKVEDGQCYYNKYVQVQE